ncbi:MAG: hypothetical protein IT573_04575 [Deltaproteobacteria bacterium]|nr:hypothetical protein [Deltaproteobacteria bacterium]
MDDLAVLLRRRSEDATLHAELDALRRESDAGLRAEGLLSLGQRQEGAGRADLAAEIYATVAGTDRGGPLQRRAEERLAVLQGRGPLGARVELLGRHFAQQASDPALLAGMAAGGAVFQSLRLATLSRLATSPTTSLLTRGLGARALSWGVGFAFEVPAFTLATRGFHALLGRELDWSREALGLEFLSAGITLFLLKSSGAGASAFTRRLARSEGSASALTRFSAVALPQAAAFTGLLGAHALETRLGLRPGGDAANAVVESLATLLQFHVGGRLIHRATGGSYERRLQAIGRRIEASRLLAPRPPSTPALFSAAGTLRPAMAGEARPLPANAVFMSSNNPNASPSNRPPAFHEGIDPSGGGKIVAHPAQLRDIKADLDRIEGTLYGIFRAETGTRGWETGARDTAREMQTVVEELQRRIGQEPSRAELLPYLAELGLEYRTVQHLVDRAILSDRELPPSDALDIRRFFTYYYRSANNLINFIDHTALIQQPLENARRARSWLQRGLEGERAAEIEEAIIHPDSPYVRLPDGSYNLRGSGLHVALIGDENAPRTFQLAEMGHRVTHLSDDPSVLRTTERRLHLRTQRKRESGEYKFDFSPAIDFRPEAEAMPPADLIEAFFPRQLSELAPRSSPERQASLQDFLNRQIKARLAPEGSAFILADRDEAIEDLANLVLRDRGIELLEVRQRRTHLPLMGGPAVTIEPGEAMVSWLLFRKLGETPR